ncbi:MAG: ATP-dependent DNA helicase RecQ [Bdellovibrionota bacterium]
MMIMHNEKNQNAMLGILQSRFGLDHFRRGQQEIIRSILAGQDTLAVMPTGGGKSLCYQLPALINQGITIVISPLISLMRDQVTNLRGKNIPAGCIHSGQSPIEKRQVFREIENNDAYLLYLSPERVQKEGFIQWFQQRPITLIAIDEAHCVSQWGHDFRPDYAHLKLMREYKPNVPILASTATATPMVLSDISHVLGMHKPDRHIYGFYRPNLFYQVEDCVSDEHKFTLIKQAIAQTPEGRIVIYAGTRKNCEYLQQEISVFVPQTDFYHAGLADETRSQIQDAFEQGDIRVLIATNAFGMGIDHPDIRLVVHYQIPANIESYYQEMGRAGRDNKPSTCLLLYAKKDKGLQSYFIGQSQAPKAVINNKWRSLDALIHYCEGAGMST